MTDAHYSSYAELLERVQWEKYGVVDGVARDSRCENCMVHCGYEPTASLGLDRKSTRLNSSHLVISYAVFCLKKKKNESLTVCQTGAAEAALTQVRTSLSEQKFEL